MQHNTIPKLIIMIKETRNKNELRKKSNENEKVVCAAQRY